MCRANCCLPRHASFQRQQRISAGSCVQSETANGDTLLVLLMFSRGTMGGSQSHRGTSRCLRGAQSGQQQALAGSRSLPRSRCIGDRGPNRHRPKRHSTCECAERQAPAQVLPCGCCFFPNVAAVREMLCRGSSYLSSVLSNAAAFWKLMEIGMELAPTDGSPGPKGDRAPIRSTIKVIAISAALCLKGTGLHAKKRSPTCPTCSEAIVVGVQRLQELMGLRGSSLPCRAMRQCREWWRIRDAPGPP